MDGDTQSREIVRLEIQGMSCAACAAAVERGLNELDGVEASVNLATGKATIHCAPETRAGALVAAVESSGYGARLAGEPPPPERSDAWRLPLAAVLAVPVVVLAMMAELRFPGWEWVALGLSTPVVFVAGSGFHRMALTGLRHRRANMDTLVSIGTIAAWSWSATVLVAGLRSGTYFEVGAVVTTLILLGRALEARAKARSAAAIRGLAGLAAKEARVVRDGREALVPIDELEPGDLFAVRPGERIATDGIVVEGGSAVDVSMLTGEPLPLEAGAGTAVTGGTIVLDGRLVVRASRVGSETTLSRIAHLVEEAQSGKANAQRLADRVSAIFVPAVLVLSLATLAGQLAFGSGAARAFTAAVAVLVISCPCALGLATPTALMAGTGRGAQIGVLIRGPRVLEQTRRIDTIVLDKTGTLTEGSLELDELELLNGATRAEVLRFAGAAESASEHPVAEAVVRAARRELGTLPAVTGFRNEPGVGVRGTVEGTEVAVGRSGGRIEVHWGGVPRARLSLRDRVKPTSAQAVRELKALGLTPVLLTGDSYANATRVAAEVGIEEVAAEVSPEGKAAEIARLQGEGRVVAMAGDGVNDAPALARADLGLAVGTGTDIAIAAADLTLVSGDLRAAVDAIRLARATFRTIEWNLVWAFAYNVAAIPLAVAGVLSPIVAAAAMGCSSLFVVGNSLRLTRFRSVRT
ncbi:MAG TPA: heavy metal translocating P-type ATPase [Gaiellaceae bacterium]|nr:heavy metal translocating P-type ATPase [Gaiellaceae bacterium]